MTEFFIDLDKIEEWHVSDIPQTFSWGGQPYTVLQTNTYGGFYIGQQVKYLLPFTHLLGGEVEFFFYDGDMVCVKYKNVLAAEAIDKVEADD